ncbi:NADH-quinone oxidoreductase subunit F, partial [Neisseria meningitidis]
MALSPSVLPFVPSATAHPSCLSLDASVHRGGYTSLRTILSGNISQTDVIDDVQTSGLRSRGGAGFPTGLK